MFSDSTKTPVDAKRPKNGPVPVRPGNGSPTWKDASFSVLCGGLHRCDPLWNKPADGADQCYKLYLCIDGRAELTLHKQAVSLSAGSAYFIPGYQLARQACDRSMDVYWVHFVPDSLYLSFLMSHVPEVHAWPLASLAGWRETWQQIPRLFQRPPQWLHYRVQAMLLFLVSQVLERYNFSHMAAVDPVFEQLQPAITFMEDHLLDSPSLAEVARAVHLAPNYFHRKFTGTFHLTPLAYMQQRRLNIARQLLLGTKHTLEQIAYRCGFNSPFYFSRMFKKHYRVSPARYREQSGP